MHKIQKTSNDVLFPNVEITNEKELNEDQNNVPSSPNDAHSIQRYERVELMLKLPRFAAPMTQEDEATIAYITDNLSRLVCKYMDTSFMGRV